MGQAHPRGSDAVSPQGGVERRALRKAKSPRLDGHHPRSELEGDDVGVPGGGPVRPSGTRAARSARHQAGPSTR